MTLGTLTELQLAVMNVLWDLSEGTVADVHEALEEDRRELAKTTVATLLQRLSKQGWVGHRRAGRRFLYSAAVPKEKAAKGALRRLVQGFFRGNVTALTAQLLESEKVTDEELEAMRALLDEKAPR